MPKDYSKYLPNWLKEIQSRVSNRAENGCEQCRDASGVTHLEAGSGVVFAIHLHDKYPHNWQLSEDLLDALWQKYPAAATSVITTGMMGSVPYGMCSLLRNLPRLWASVSTANPLMDYRFSE